MLGVGAIKSRLPFVKFKCHSEYQKREISENVIFSENFDIFKDLSGFCYTSPPRGNQVGDLPRALSMILGVKLFFSMKVLAFVLRYRLIDRFQLC